MAGDAVEVLWLGVEVVLHKLDAFVKPVADFGVVVDPVDFVFWHGYPYEIAISLPKEELSISHFH